MAGLRKKIFFQVCQSQLSFKTELNEHEQQVAKKKASNSSNRCCSCSPGCFLMKQLFVFDLQKEGGGVDDIDDANGHEVFEEYEWAGQTRIRATTLLEGGFRGNSCFFLVEQGLRFCRPVSLGSMKFVRVQGLFF